MKNDQYKPVVSLVNGEIIEDLLNLCNEQFIHVIIQQYAGARGECLFCGASETNNGEVDHSAADCPVIKYQELVEKHKRFIVKK